MKIIDLKEGKEVHNTDAPLCLALGNFDGVHRGHRALIKMAVEEGRKNGLKTGIWTFADHPMNTLCASRVSYLTSNREKNEIFAESGLDYVIYEEFSAVRDMAPQEFAKKILVEGLDCRIAVCGFNFRFGRRGLGDAECLQRLMTDMGRRAITLPPVTVNGKAVSSTAIRQLIEEGDTEGAAELLGRPYSVTLPVIYGKQLGRTLGLPTINQRLEGDRVTPKKGVYVSVCHIDGKRLPAVSNIGCRPTVNDNGNDVNCETHIIGYEGSLYGQCVKVSFYSKLRDEVRFCGVEELKKAVENDVLAAEKYFFERKGLLKK